MFFLIVATVIALDQWSKGAVLNAIGIGGEPIKVIKDFFYITCHRNSGAAWGMFQGGRYPLIVLTFVALAVVVYAMFKVKDKWFRILTAVFTGGALGNLYDRIIHGSVVDFLDFYIFGYNFPTFNVADICIVIGTISLALYLMVNKGILAQFEKKARISEPGDGQGVSGDAEGRDMAADAEERAAHGDVDERGMAADADERVTPGEVDGRGLVAEAEERAAHGDVDERGMAADTEGRDMAADAEERAAHGDVDERTAP